MVRKATTMKQPKLRGRLQQVTIGLPPDLVVRLDKAAAEEKRSRGRQIEVLIENWLSERQQRKVA
jgi:metal-responsive CopG/Arc/MetJ family transcriptional regulator